MTRRKPIGKTRSDISPLTLHKTGQHCKKIRGKMYCFGTEKHRAFGRDLERAASLDSGNPSKPKPGSAHPALY
jgi:hypothetical protein